MATKAMLVFLITAAELLSIFSEVVSHRPLTAPSPVSDHIGRTVTATKEMAKDIANSAAPKVGEAAQAVKDTAKNAVDSVAPTVNKADDAAKDAAKRAKETNGAWASWFKHKLGNLGIIRRGPAEPVKLPLSAPPKSTAPAPVKMQRMP